MKKTSHISPSRAFTIIELLVVIAIIALLSGIIMSNLTGSKAKARDAKRVSDLGQIQLALEMFYDRCRAYPASLVLADDGTTGGGQCPSGINFGSFIPTIPKSPKPVVDTEDYDYVPLSYNGDGRYDTYFLRVALESYNPALQDDIDTNPQNWTDNSIGDQMETYCLDTGGPYPYQYCLISN